VHVGRYPRSPSSLHPYLPPSSPHTHIGNLRSRRAELSQEEEDTLVSSKLERTAESYNRILTWQLLQHRELYEARVKMVQAFAIPGSQRQSTTGSGQRSFSEAVMLSLDMESDKAKKMTETAQARLHAAQEELDLLNKLHASLEANEQDWQRKVSAADAQLQGIEKKCREGIPKLEKTVASLMQRMDKQVRMHVTCSINSSECLSNSISINISSSTVVGPDVMAIVTSLAAPGEGPTLN